MSERRNIETKARCRDLGRAAALAAGAGARRDCTLDQRDTYFDLPDGRLKVREVRERREDGVERAYSEVIRYRRADVDGARVSSYTIEPVTDARAAAAELEAQYPRRGVVAKHRELWLHGRTRIHLDEVHGLGAFVELETVDDGDPAARLWEEHHALSEALGLAADALVGGSYIDLLTAAS